MKHLIIIITLFISVTSCNEDIKNNKNKPSIPSFGNTGSLPKSNGIPGSVLVSIDSDLWVGEIEEIFIEKFKDTAVGPYIYLEHKMDFEQEDPTTINKNRKRNKNFLRIILDDDNELSETEVLIKKDYKALNQLYIIVRDSDKNRLATFLSQNLKTYIELYSIEEDERIRRKYLSAKNTDYQNKAKHSFGIDISIPESAEFVANKDSIIYALDKNVQETTRDNPKTGAKGGTYWVQKGILIWETQYINENSLDPAQILAIRDTTLKAHVNGTIKGSYMATEYAPSHKPTIEYITVDGAKAMKIEGLWIHNGNISASGGGPFVQYSIVHPTRGTIVHISTHIFAPRFNKREYIRQIRAILETIKIVD